MNQNCPATQALISLADLLPEHEYIKRSMKGFATSELSCEQPGAKRRKSSDETTLDMFDLLSSMKPVEDSIAFPTIEWTYDDGEESEGEQDNATQSCGRLHADDEDNNAQYPPWTTRPYCSTSSLGKRSRIEGMSRSKSQKLSLVSLVSTSTSSNDLRSQCLKSLNAPSLALFSLGPLGSVDHGFPAVEDPITLVLEALAA
eukprot:CAMPEP_0119015288 /NCGR_PEP_ID=MMETSP1176-20130426/10752_1 /TAXON_ID=265551 /ORGANISM="Synedropsis recta cf, Strain CCMP1620" /LENGTH=200 /DNA_ID=CAMNT_0006968567 /DNA_START=71 /DNA_END=673 /DNA_ORIENTATION=+